MFVRQRQEQGRAESGRLRTTLALPLTLAAACEGQRCQRGLRGRSDLAQHPGPLAVLGRRICPAHPVLERAAGGDPHIAAVVTRRAGPAVTAGFWRVLLGALELKLSRHCAWRQPACVRKTNSYSYLCFLLSHIVLCIFCTVCNNVEHHVPFFVKLQMFVYMFV